MSALPYHKRYHSDALAGFMPLTLEERGAYQTLLDMIYDRGGPLIDNERLLAGYMNCSVRKWRILREQLLAKGKISLTKDGLITNSRAQLELENTMKTHRKLTEAGAKGGRTRVEKRKFSNENNERNKASLEPASSDPQAISETRSQSSEDKSSAAGPLQNGGDPVKEIFDLGVSILTEAGVDKSRARSLIGRWRKAKGDGDVLIGLLECRKQDISDPVEWLTKRFAIPKYVSASGYEYRGDLASIKREAEKRSDWNTYWSVVGDEKRATEGGAR